MNRTSQLDVQHYYRQVTEVDIGDVARDLLAGRITQESGSRMECDCPNHHSQSHRSLHIMLDKQGWYCFGCGVGGDVCGIGFWQRSTRLCNQAARPTCCRTVS